MAKDFGNVTAKPDALVALQDKQVDANELLDLHFGQKYGDVDEETAFLNDLAWLQHRGVAKSTYRIDEHQLINITTRWGQILTTLELEEEYAEVPSEDWGETMPDVD